MSTQEDDYDICGVTGGDIDDCCGQKVLAEDTMMIDNTSVCVGCYEKLNCDDCEDTDWRAKFNYVVSNITRAGQIERGERGECVFM